MPAFEVLDGVANTAGLQTGLTAQSPGNPTGPFLSTPSSQHVMIEPCREEFTYQTKSNQLQMKVKTDRHILYPCSGFRSTREYILTQLATYLEARVLFTSVTL